MRRLQIQIPNLLVPGNFSKNNNWKILFHLFPFLLHFFSLFSFSIAFFPFWKFAPHPPRIPFRTAIGTMLELLRSTNLSKLMTCYWCISCVLTVYCIWCINRVLVVYCIWSAPFWSPPVVVWKRYFDSPTLNFHKIEHSR